MIWLFLFAALVAGVFITIQTGVNAQLAQWVKHPMLASLISFIVGTTGLIVYAIALRIPLPSLSSVSQAPWWVWTGGLLGAFVVSAMTILAPKLGAALLVGTVMGGQMVASLVMDHYGLLGFSVRPINGWRVVGAVLLVAGVLLIRRF